VLLGAVACFLRQVASLFDVIAIGLMVPLVVLEKLNDTINCSRYFKLIGGSSIIEIVKKKAKE
jgi:hypothetical protein